VDWASAAVSVLWIYLSNLFDLWCATRPCQIFASWLSIDALIPNSDLWDEFARNEMQSVKKQASTHRRRDWHQRCNAVRWRPGNGLSGHPISEAVSDDAERTLSVVFTQHVGETIDAAVEIAKSNSVTEAFDSLTMLLQTAFQRPQRDAWFKQAGHKNDSTDRMFLRT
jgi:hypothetical protein